MSKTIMVTGSTDGIGFEAVKMFAEEKNTILVHGRNAEKVQRVLIELKNINSNIETFGFVADLSDMIQVKNLAEEVKEKINHLDVLINNAGVFVVKGVSITKDGFDVRFMVNTIAPYLLTKSLLPIMTKDSRVVNLSSAAQAPVDFSKLLKGVPMQHGDAYAQSKLAITMWTKALATKVEPLMVSLNPKSFLGSNMVKEGYGIEGHDVRIGGDIIKKSALSDEFKDANGKYFDNDQGTFAQPHPDVMNDALCTKLVEILDDIITK